MPRFWVVFVLMLTLALAGSAAAAPPPAASASAPPAPSASAAASGSAAPAEKGDLKGLKPDEAKKPDSDQTKVYIGYHVISVRNVDLHGQTFYADFYMWLRFSGVDEDKAKTVKQNLEFMNGKPDSMDISEEKMIGTDTYYICWRVRGTFSFEAHLQQYPFDTQELDIVVENSELETHDMVFVNDTETYVRSGQEKNRWAVRTDVNIPDFHLKKVDLNIVNSLYKTDFGDLTPGEMGDSSTYSRALVQMYFQRDFLPYVFKILIPLAVIMAMAYVVFFLPAKEVSTATGITITALLSCIAFNVTVAQNMPDVGYLVVSDKFFMATYFLIFLTLVQNVATYVLDEKGLEKRAEKLEKISRFVFPVLYVGIFVYLLLAAFGSDKA